MQNIQITDEKYGKLNERAVAAGYKDVSALIDALVEEPADDPRGSLSETELRESAAECDQGVAEIKAGGGLDFRQAMLDIGRERGFPLPE